MGSLTPTRNGSVVGNDYYLSTAGDIVADPSAPNAFVEGIMEGKTAIQKFLSYVEIKTKITSVITFALALTYLFYIEQKISFGITLVFFVSMFSLLVVLPSLIVDIFKLLFLSSFLLL